MTSAETMQWPLPDLTDPEFAPYWRGTAQGRLLVQRCQDCESMRWPPRPVCSACTSMRCDWPEVSGLGRVYTWTEVHRTPLAAFGSLVPYVVAVVALAEESRLRMVGVLELPPGAVATIDLPVRAHFRAMGQGVHITCWRSDPAGDGIIVGPGSDPSNRGETSW